MPLMEAMVRFIEHRKKIQVFTLRSNLFDLWIQISSEVIAIYFNILKAGGRVIGISGFMI